MLRTLVAIVVGVASAMLTITLVEMVARPLHPMPQGLVMTDTAGMAAYVSTAPVAMMLMVLSGWVLGAFDGALVAALIARRHPRPAAMVVGAVVVAAVIANAVLLPHPVWMTVLGVLLPLVAAFGASMLALRIKTRSPATA